MDFKSFGEVDNLTFKEYRLLMKACELKRVDREYELHLQAFLNIAVQATKNKKGSLKYNRFEKFYDYEKAEKRVLAQKNKPSERLLKMEKIYKKFEEGG